MAPQVSSYILALNEREIIPFTIRHYQQFCRRVVLLDLGSTDGSQEIALKAGCELVQHDCKNSFDDRLNQGLKNNCWVGTNDDWAIMADADEMLAFPAGAELTLNSYAMQGLAVVRPYGYEMLSDTYPSGDGQAYDEVKQGARDDHWYGKSILISPKLAAKVEFSTGAHTVTVFLKNGRRVVSDHKTPFACPSAHLRHFHHIGGIERVSRLYNENRARQSAKNREMKWGLQEDGLTHAQRKRALILQKLERVVP